MIEPTVHATALVVPTPRGPEGLLVTGLSGSGKSALALALIEEARGFAMLVADDRVVLQAVNGALLAHAPTPLAGLIERRGVGLLRRPHLPRARMHAHVELADAVERMPAPRTAMFEGVALPSLLAPPADAAAMVWAWLQIRT